MSVPIDNTESEKFGRMQKQQNFIDIITIADQVQTNIAQGASNESKEKKPDVSERRSSTEAESMQQTQILKKHA